MRSPQASPYIPAHGKISRSSNRADTAHTKTVIQKNKKDYTTYYHSSDSATPPHLTEHPKSATYRTFPEEHGRSGSNDVIFAGTALAADAFSRPYTHQYRVPKESESATIMADDDLEQLVKNQVHPDAAKHQFETALYRKSESPTLFESLSAKRSEVASRNEVQRMRNGVEDRGNISVIMPKSKMESLGIQYRGMNIHSDNNYSWKMPESLPAGKKKARVVLSGKPAGDMVWNSDKGSSNSAATHKAMNKAPETIKQSKKYSSNFPLAQHKKPKQTKVNKKDAYFDLTGES